MLERYVKSRKKRFIIKRLLKAIPVLIIATVVAFMIMRIGDADPAARILGKTATEEAIEAFKAKHGLDQPLHIQYIDWIGGLFKGDLGTSLRYDTPINGLIKDRIPITFQLIFYTIIIAVSLGITMGVIGALKQNTWIDHLVTVQSLVWLSTPAFYLGILFLLFFALYLPIFPTSGYEGPYYLILPSIVMGLRMQAIFARLTRSSMLNVLNKEYIKTAKTKGLKNKTIIVKHALRNALIPVVTVVAMRVPWMFGATMVTEQIFNIPGMGRLVLKGVLSRDFMLVQSVILLITIMVVIANLLADIAYTYIDPRIEIGTSTTEEEDA